MLSINQFKKVTGVHITTKHAGKMSGLCSISTSSVANTFCQTRSNIEGSICQFCFSNRMQKRYGTFGDMLKKNLEILTNDILPVENMPDLSGFELCRFEAFGDLMNTNQFINYLNIAKANSSVNCAIWTKNIAIVKKVFDMGYSKPENLQIVISSPFVNSPIKSKFSFVDKVFTVYSPEFIKANNVLINCGALSCAACQKCYHNNGIKHISEKIK